MKNISIIAAVDKNMLIGKANHLPWNIPEDLKFFRDITWGHLVLMGKNTWISIGKPLTGRVNIILTHDKDFFMPGCVVINSPDQILLDYNERHIFVIGGASIFKQFLPFADKMYLTRIEHVFEGDIYFPEVLWNEWELVSYEQKNSVTGYSLNFEQWQHKTPN